MNEPAGRDQGAEALAEKSARLWHSSMARASKPSFKFDEVYQLWLIGE